MNDKQVIDLLKSKDRKTFKIFIEEHQEQVRNICFRFLNSEEDVEEIAQDVFVEIYKSISHFRGESRLSTWVYQIAVAKSIDHIRKIKRKKRFGMIKQMLGLNQAENRLIAPDGDSPDKIIEAKERTEVLRQAVESLPENQRIAVTLTKYENYSYKEVGDIMGMSLSSIESLIHRAKINLQKKLCQYYGKVL